MTTAEQASFILICRIAQAVIDGKLTNAVAAELLRKLSKQLNEASNAKAATE